MKKNEVKIGGLYVAKVSDRLVTVRIDGTHSRAGWNATNTRTGKRIHVKSAQRLRSAAKGASSPEASDATERAETAVASAAKDDTREAPAKAVTRKTKKAKREQKRKRVSALDAAAQVLAKTEKPMGARELVTAMAEQGLWKSPNGKTPHATLYAAMLREARDKDSEARFKKVDRGMFEFNKAGA